MNHHWFVPEGDCDGTAIVFLSGRGSHSRYMMQLYCGHLNNNSDEEKILIGIDPDGSWYPQPYGPDNQKDAVAGCEKKAEELNQYIAKILEELHVLPENIALVGFSAGAVIALQAASKQKYAGVICHNGCVLDPNILGPVPITARLYHSKDDVVFSWTERYLPTKTALLQRGGDVTFKQHRKGGHRISLQDVTDAVKTIRKMLRRS